MDGTTSRVLALSLLVLACSSDPGRADPPRAERAPVTSPDRACESLPRADCLRARHCTLVQPGGEGAGPTDYACRDASGTCEEGLLQGHRSACEARPGCVFEGARCYCHCRGYGQTAVPDGDEAEPCACACAGGPPAICRAQTVAAGPAGGDRPALGSGVEGAGCGGTGGHGCDEGLVCAYPGGPHPGLGRCARPGTHGTPCGPDRGCDEGLECRVLPGDFHQCEPASD